MKDMAMYLHGCSILECLSFSLKKFRILNQTQLFFSHVLPLHSDLSRPPLIIQELYQDRSNFDHLALFY